VAEVQNVVAVGGGPVGVTALALLGRAGLRAVGVEREPTAWPDPRAVHFDGETMRLLRGIDEYMRGTGRLMRAKIPKIWGPGRHRAGDNTFTYFHDPNGNTTEYTTELEQLDEDVWHPSIFSTEDPETADQWGTANPMNEWVTSQMFNDPDKGCFVAPPV
jgi:2-polyprenyl-6-methoxyphenol hydroxylase-like FAD-dependent oxidoreductase